MLPKRATSDEWDIIKIKWRFQPSLVQIVLIGKSRILRMASYMDTVDLSEHVFEVITNIYTSKPSGFVKCFQTIVDDNNINSNDEVDPPTVTMIITATANCHHDHHNHRQLSPLSSQPPPSVTIIITTTTISICQHFHHSHCQLSL